MRFWGMSILLAAALVTAVANAHPFDFTADPRREPFKVLGLSSNVTIGKVMEVLELATRTLKGEQFGRVQDAVGKLLDLRATGKWKPGGEVPSAPPGPRAPEPVNAPDLRANPYERPWAVLGFSDAQWKEGVTWTDLDVAMTLAVLRELDSPRLGEGALRTFAAYKRLAEILPRELDVAGEAFWENFLTEQGLEAPPRPRTPLESAFRSLGLPPTATDREIGSAVREAFLELKRAHGKKDTEAMDLATGKLVARLQAAGAVRAERDRASRARGLHREMPEALPLSESPCPATLGRLSQGTPSAN